MAQRDTTAADIFDRHHLAVFKFFRRVTGRPDVAEDLTQEVFLRVVRGLQQYRTIGREAAWVYRIARHVLIDHRRQHANTLRSLTEADAEDAVTLPTQIVAFGLQEAVSRLPDAEREAFLLRELAGLTYREIAVICETTEDGVWTRLYRARHRLRRLLSGRLSSGARPGDERGTS